MPSRDVSSTESRDCQWPALMKAMFGATVIGCEGVPPATQVYEYEGDEYDLCDECYVSMCERACKRAEAAH